MDKKENRTLEFSAKFFSLLNNKFSNILELKKNKQSNFIKQNKEIKVIINNKISNNKPRKVSKFKCRKGKIIYFGKKLKIYFLFI